MASFIVEHFERFYNFFILMMTIIILIAAVLTLSRISLITVIVIEVIMLLSDHDSLSLELDIFICNCMLISYRKYTRMRTHT